MPLTHPNSKPNQSFNLGINEYQGPVMDYSVSLLTLLLIAQDVFLSELAHIQAHKHADTSESH